MSRPLRLVLRAAAAVVVMTVAIGLVTSVLFGIGVFPLAAMIALIHASIGVPLYFLARAWREVRFVDAAVAGFLIGALPVQAYNLYAAIGLYGWSSVMGSAGDPEIWRGVAFMVALLGGSGAIAGIIFLLVMRTEPDATVAP